MKHALNDGKMKKMDQLPKEKSLGIFSKREKNITFILIVRKGQKMMYQLFLQLSNSPCKTLPYNTDFPV